jgi:hypothetical protein
VVVDDSFSLLQPANNAKVTRPIAIIALVFIVVSYFYKFVRRFLYPELQIQHRGILEVTLNHRLNFAAIY